MPKKKTGRIEIAVLEEIIHELRLIRRMMEPKPTFRLHINRILFGSKASQFFAYQDASISTWNPITGKVNEMAAITAGQSASFFLSATASDNSTPALTGQTLTADDSTVTISPDTTDSTGNTFTVTVPASDTQKSFNLSASASVTSNTSSTAQTVTATLSVTVSPASQPVTFTLTINEK